MLDIKHQISKGFTLVELMLVMGIFSALIGISSISLFNAQHKSSITSAVAVFIADLKSQQLRAMAGEEDGGGAAADYGIHFETNSYTQFRGSYGTVNFLVNLPPTVQFTSPNTEIIFQKGSGEIANATSVTFRDSSGNLQKTVSINKYGVVTGVN